MKPIKRLSHADKPVPVEVWWWDAITNSSWFSEADLVEWANENLRLPIRQVGWLIHQDDDCIIVTGSLHSLADDFKKYNSPIWIPRPWIAKMKRLDGIKPAPR